MPRWRPSQRGRRRPGPERGRVLWRAADIARRRVDEIAQTLTREEGKILKEAKGEVLKGIALLEYYAGEGFRMHGKTLPSESRDTFTYTLRQPLGAVGLIAPWNFPWAIPVWKSAPAIVAGNAPSSSSRRELTPATSALLAEIYEEAGLPPGVFNMVVGTRLRGRRGDGRRAGAARDLVHRIERRRRRALREGRAARRQGHLRDGRQERRDRDAGRRSRQGGGGDPRRRVRFDRPALHRDLARDRASGHQVDSWSIGSSRWPRRSSSGPDSIERPTWGRRSTRSSGRR